MHTVPSPSPRSTWFVRTDDIRIVSPAIRARMAEIYMKKPAMMRRMVIVRRGLSTLDLRFAMNPELYHSYSPNRVEENESSPVNGRARCLISFIRLTSSAGALRFRHPARFTLWDAPVTPAPMRLHMCVGFFAAHIAFETFCFPLTRFTRHSSVFEISSFDRVTSIARTVLAVSSGCRDRVKLLHFSQ